MSSRSIGPEPAPGVVVAADLRTAAGSPLPVEVTLTNTASTPRVITVGAIGVDASWLPPMMRTETLLPGQSAVVTLTLSPAVGTVPAQYPLVFTAQSLDPETGRPGGAPATMADTVLVVNPRNQLELDLTPRRSSIISSRRLRMAMRNTGDQPARVRLGVQASPRLRVRFRRQDVEVLPGASAVVKGRVSVPRPRFFGTVTHHSFTVSARGTESVRHVEGSVTQRPFVNVFLLKVLALLAVLSIWIAAAVVFIPQLADRLGSGQTETTTVAQKDDGDGDQGGQGGDQGGGDQGGAGGGGAGDGGAASGGGAGGGTTAKPAAATQRLSLSGTVAGDQPGGVRVRLEPTSLVDEDAQGGIGVGVSSSELGQSGMSLASSFRNQALASTPRDRSVMTTADGSWGFADVTSPGYYLLTFSKAGYQSRSYVVDSTSETAADPLEVDLTAGEGTLSGSVAGPGGAVGAATVTISDGTNTITTSTNSRGKVGTWSVSGLSTPATYVVQASKPGLSSESRMVDLAAGGSAGADLHLQSGVASLVGKVRAIDETGDLAGVGGVQVTVTDSEGKVRTATTLTQGEKASHSSARASAGFVGTYTVPGLVAPGDYVVSYSGTGLQTQTSKISLKSGQSSVTVDSDLTSSSGTVTGTIAGGDGTPIVGAGLTLQNADNAYKTMSTSDPAGSYLFNGVAPGTYSLSTQFFGYVTDHVTVTVKAGRTTELDRGIAEMTGGVLAGRSKLQGQVVDAGTGLAISCPTPGAECVTAQVFEPDVDTKAGAAESGVSYSTSFLPGDTFNLPEDAAKGLLPGLHKVQVTAPHYELSETQVQVPADGTVNIGTLGLYPAPKILGTITTIVGVPTGATCVWAVPVGQAAPTADCSTSKDHACSYQSGTFAAAATEPEPVCAYVNGRGSYSLEVLEHGTYDVYVLPSDPTYEAPEVTTKVLGVGDTQNYSVPLHRKGRITITARKPGPTGDLVPATGVVVTLDPAGAGADLHGTTDGNGRAFFEGLADDTYALSAGSGGLSDQRAVFVGLDQDVAAELTLTHPIDNVVGQVTATIDGAPKNVGGATVAVTAPASYSAGATVPGTATMVTNATGCFAIQPAAEDATPVTPAAGACPGLGGWSGTSLAVKTFRSNVASSIQVSKAGFEPLTLATRPLTSGVNGITLEPQPVDATQLSVATDPSPNSIDWSRVTFSVAPTGGGTWVSATATGGHLTWTDTRVPSGFARPGHYLVTASAPGYVSQPKEVFCDIAVACAWSAGQLTLTQEGALKIRALDGAAPVTGARFTLVKGTQEIQTITAAAGESSVTFTGLAPNATDYQVEVRAAGYAFGTVGGGGAALASSCGTTVTIEPGSTLDCSAPLSRLNTVTGTVSGLLAQEGGTDPDARKLTGADVTLTRCLTKVTISGTTYCRTTDPTTSFTTTAGAQGAFTLKGDVVRAGIANGDWLLTATAPGFHLPRTPHDPADTAHPTSTLPRGVLVAGLASDRTVNVDLFIDLVNLTVNVKDQAGPVTDATVRLTFGGQVLTPTSATAGAYLFEQIVPRTYSASVVKAGYPDAGEDVPTVEGTLVQSRTITIRRSASTATGVVKTTTGQVVDGVAVRVCADDACAQGAATGVDRQPMSTTSAGDGSYQFRYVPNGTYFVQFRKHGYPTTVLGPYVFDEGAGSVPPISPVLAGVSRNAAITLTSPWAGNALSGIQVKLQRNSQTLTATTDASGTASFTNVGWGCWSVVATEARANHHAEFGGVQSTGPADAAVGACASGLVVSGDSDDSSAATGTVAVKEGALNVKVAQQVVAGFDTADDPTTATVAITRTGASSPLVTLTPVSVASSGNTIVWVPPGSYTMTAEPTTADPFWPRSAAVSASVPATPTGSVQTAGFVTATTTLVEQSATLDVAVLGQVDGDPATADLTLSNAEGVTLPTQYAGTLHTDADYQATLELPKGTWTVTVTAPRGAVSAPVSITAPGGYTTEVTLP